jgi:hypothetical protein
LGIGSSGSQKRFVADINGDGNADLVQLVVGPNGKTLADVLFSNGGAFARSPATPPQNIGPWAMGGERTPFVALDANGDGKSDLARNQGGGAAPLVIDVLGSTGTGFARFPGQTHHQPLRFLGCALSAFFRSAY